MVKSNGRKESGLLSQPQSDNSNGIARDFWENHLQMCIDPWLQSAAEPQIVRRWLSGLNKRQLHFLCEYLGVASGSKPTRQRESLLACNGRLTPYYLVARFAYRRSRFVVSDYAATVLPKLTYDGCRSGDKFDTLALLMALYHKDPEHLKTVYHLEKVHSSGFARMKLKGQARQPKKSFKEFLTSTLLRRLLAQFDEQKNDGRASEFMDIVPDTDHPVAFIRREERRSMLLRSSRAVHGFKPEWIILNFRNNGKRVDISSHSMSVPLELANRIASDYFGTDCEYENEVDVTPKALIEKFFDLLKHDQVDFLKLVEVHVKNSPLDGAPVLKISSEGDESVAESVRHFEKVIGAILADLDLVKAIKVLFCGKRVTMTFEAVPDAPEGYCVRYTDKTLNRRERDAFENKFRKEPYGIRVLSTEKRHKKSRG